VVSLLMMTSRFALLFGISIGISGCSTASYTPNATLLFGFAQYQGEMQRLASSSTRWPERQRTGSTLKTIITATVGGSPEFYRLVDLDVRKREFVLTMRDDAVRPDRVKEMTDELVQMDEEIAALKPVIRTQLAAPRFESDPGQRIEDTATRGMLSLALDGFSSNKTVRGFEPPSTKVGQFVVTDLGAFSTVRTPEGHMFRCFVFGVPEEGAGVKCEPAK
jgi:hypothetical protein